MLSMLKCLRDIANYFKSLPKYTAIRKTVYDTMSTNMKQVHSIEVPPNSYVSISATAVWSNTKPTTVLIQMSGDGYQNALSEGYAGYQNATAASSFYTETGCTLSVQAKYPSATKNRVIISGFIMTVGGNATS